MARPGRPRLTPEDLLARITEYRERYAAPKAETGLPVFPTGKRETRQHREWLSLYKAHARLARAGSPGIARDDRGALLQGQGGLCPICALAVDLRDAVDHGSSGGSVGAVLHARCGRLVTLAAGLGPEGLDRLRAFLWPETTKPRKPRLS